MNKNEMIELLTNELSDVISCEKKEEAKEKIISIVEILMDSKQEFLRPKDNDEALKLFIYAKRIEGCSDKSLKYYRTTLQLTLKTIEKEYFSIIT